MEDAKNSLGDIEECAGCQASWVGTKVLYGRYATRFAEGRMQVVKVECSKTCGRKEYGYPSHAWDTRGVNMIRNGLFPDRMVLGMMKACRPLLIGRFAAGMMQVVWGPSGNRTWMG